MTTINDGDSVNSMLTAFSAISSIGRNKIEKQVPVPVTTFEKLTARHAWRLYGLVIWFSGGLVSVKSEVVLGDLGGLFQSR